MCRGTKSNSLDIELRALSFLANILYLLNWKSQQLSTSFCFILFLTVTYWVKQAVTHFLFTSLLLDRVAVDCWHSLESSDVKGFRLWLRLGSVVSQLSVL